MRRHQPGVPCVDVQGALIQLAARSVSNDHLLQGQRLSMISSELSVLPENIVTRTTVLNDGEAEQKRHEILQYFHKSFDLYESLFDTLASEEAFTAKASPLRHPLIFYFGHTAVFYINKLNVAKLIDERVDPALESTLAIGVDEMSWDDLNDKNYPWPTAEQVKAYRDKARIIVDRFIRTCDVQLPVGWEDPLWMIMMGIEHERIHLETSSVLIRDLPLSKVQPHTLWSTICTTSGDAPVNMLLPVAGGDISLGKSRQDALYGWDVEYGSQTTTVADFKASQFLVSNHEFFEFMQAGGYEKREYWTDEGWGWIRYRNASHQCSGCKMAIATAIALCWR